MSAVPARVAAEAAAAMSSLSELAATAQPTTPPAPVAEVPPAPAPPAPPTPVAAPVDLGAELAKINRQMGSLQGRFEQSELERQRLARELEQARSAPPPAPPAPPTPPAGLITAKEREEFGEDLIDLIGRAVTQGIGGRFEQFGARLAAIEGRLGKVETTATGAANTAVQTAWDRYIADLNRAIPTWQAVNDTPEFLDWLEIVDTFSGQKRLDLLLNAHNQMNLDRVKSFFAAYNPELVTAPAAPAAPQAPAQPAAPAAPAPHVDPATLAAPATQAPAPAPTQQTTGRIWKDSEAALLYERKNKGLINKTDFEREEASYLEALAAGRVVANA